MIKQEILLKDKVSRNVMLFIDMIIHSKQENPPKVAWSKLDFIYHQGCTMRRPTVYLETTTLLRTHKFTKVVKIKKQINKE